MGMSNWVHLENCTIRRETDAAFLIEYEEEEYWIPKSQIADSEDLIEGDENVTVSISEWIARQKEIDIE